MTNQLPQALLFDFDGVLADTEPIHWACWRDLLAPEGIDLDWDYFERECIGLSDREFLEAVARRAASPRTVDELLPLYPLKKKMFADESLRRRLISDATVECLKSLSDKLMAVVTSSVKQEIEPILLKENVHSLMETCVYGDEVPRLKPAPDPYRIAMERLGVSSAVVFEDSKAGVQSALAAGCEVVQVARTEDLPALVWRSLQFR